MKHPQRDKVRKDGAKRMEQEWKRREAKRLKREEKQRQVVNVLNMLDAGKQLARKES
jgi:hypothetical protein